MKPNKVIFPVFAFFFLLSVIIFFFLQRPLTSFFQYGTLPLQQWAFRISSQQDVPPSLSQVQKENDQLRTQLTKMKEIERDNKALHDQFQTSDPDAATLLPATIIGSQPNALLIDKGDRDKIQVGDIVVVKDNLIGRVAKTTAHVSQVMLLTDPSISFTAQTVNTDTTGIIRSFNGAIVLANVVLADKLQKGDTVITKGDVDTKGNGYPPNLIIGKIISVDKQASSLFQAAKIQSLVDTSSLRIVFVKVE
jgi:rod shape-determining protein MreC